MTKPTHHQGAGLFERQAFEAFIGSLPAATLVRQWGDSSVGKVGGKIFAALNPATDGTTLVSFKCAEASFELLIGLAGIRPAPYLARAKWVAVEKHSPLSAKELQAYLTEAHRLVAAKLTRKLQAELGLEALIAAKPGKP